MAVPEQSLALTRPSVERADTPSVASHPGGLTFLLHKGSQASPPSLQCAFCMWSNLELLTRHLKWAIFGARSPRGFFFLGPTPPLVFCLLPNHSPPEPLRSRQACWGPSYSLGLPGAVLNCSPRHSFHPFSPPLHRRKESSERESKVSTHIRVCFWSTHF